MDTSMSVRVMGFISATGADGLEVRGATADQVGRLAALDDPRFNEMVERDYQDGIARGVSKTQTVLVNGRPFVETFTFEEISKAIEAELKP